MKWNGIEILLQKSKLQKWSDVFKLTYLIKLIYDLIKYLLFIVRSEAFGNVYAKFHICNLYNFRK